MNNCKILSSEYGAFRTEIQEYFRGTVLKEPSVILDPMAGTAPLIPFVETHGDTAFFNDILPLHFFINRAKTYDVFQHYRQVGFEWLFQQLLRCMNSLEDKVLRISDNWIDDAVLHGLVQAWHEAEEYDENSVTIFKAVILLSVRPLSSTSKSRNATWLKYGGISSGKDLREIVRESLNRFDNYFQYHYQSSQIEKRGKCTITNLNAAELRLQQKVDLVLTSPPYCNRLDPIVQYGPENYFLSALGYSNPEKDLVSSTKVKDYHKLPRDLRILTAHSEYACRLLTKIGESPIPDDPGYYLKYYTRYFAMLYEVIRKVLRYLSKTGKMYIVTQDNTHRGELIEIDKVLRELMKANGWQSKVIKKWERHHQGLRNISRNHAFVRPKQLEKLVVLWR